MSRQMRYVLFVFAVAVGPWLPAAAAVTDEEFRAMQQQLQQVLQQREQDRQEMQQLKQRLDAAEGKLGETQRLAAGTAAKAPASYPLPSEEASAKANLVITGYAHVLYEKTEGAHGSFLLGSWNPIFLFRAGDKVLFEAEPEIEVEAADGGGTETVIGLEYAQIDYLFNDYVTVVAGKMLLPLGTFIEEGHPAWINKLPSFPVPRQDETALVPESGVGVQLRGSIPVGDDHRLTYAFYGVNGPGSKDGTGAADQLDLGGGVVENNNAPSAGGRLGWFHPWQPQHDVEVGVSGQTGVWDNDSDLVWSAVVLDSAVHFGPDVELRGEYIKTWQETSDAGTLGNDGWWAQVAGKLQGLNLPLPLLRNTEAVFRYSALSRSDGHIQQYALGFIYYITSTLQFKGAYQINQSNLADFDRNEFILQAAYGF